MITDYIPPTYTISLKLINDYTSIMRFCRKQKIKFYVYEIAWKGQTVKYGIQHKHGGNGNDYGERIYTQIGHMPGWTKPNLKRCPSTKKDMDEIIKNIESTFKCKFDKDDIVVTIRDYTNAPFELDTSRRELQRIEDDLSDAHQQKYGYRPFGNKTKPTGKKIPLLKSTGLFEFEEDQ
jgi:hypothetical protein